MRINVFARGLILAAVSLGCSVVAAQTIVLHYFVRPPFFTGAGGEPGGLVGTPIIAAFKEAGIPFVFANTPFSRQVRQLQENQGYDCLLGYFKTPEREKIAKFTKPVFRDKEKIALTAADHPSLKEGLSIDALLSDPELSLLVKQGYSYGDDIDRLIEKFQPRRQVVAVESIQMLKMIAARRADYMLITPEEAIPAILEAGLDLARFRMVTLGNLPKPEYRYIMCSQRVPDEVITRLNAVIKFKP